MKSLTGKEIDLLLEWYEAHKRSLPWREDVTPYRVWVSEIMLQQTRVEAAREYYLRWMRRFPTLSDLAAASEEEVLKYWEGLGYYSRARNLHKAAKIVAAEQGELPRDKKALGALPGIGDYTVGAILSIAFGEKTPAVDGNVLRVISRLRAEPLDLARGETRTAVAEMLAPLMPEGRTSSFTQALFELGALICLPNARPHCDLCPLKGSCEAHSLGRETDFPPKVPKAEKKKERLTVFVLEHDGKYALRKRPEKGLLANLWELPNRAGSLSVEEVAALFEGEIRPLPAAKHIFTHVLWEMTGYLVRLRVLPEDKSLRFLSPEEMAEGYSLPSAFSAYKSFCK